VALECLYCGRNIFLTSAYCVLLQAQHHGLMAMMTALDDNQSLALQHRSLPADTTVNHAAKQGRPRSRGSRKINKINTHQQQQKKDAAQTKPADANELPTDVSVTPLSSDDLSFSPNPPAKIANKDCSEGRLVVRNDSGVRGALAELQQLQGSFTDRRLLRVPPPSADANPVGKENRTNPSTTGRRPFEALLDSLRRMNPELGGGRSRSMLPSVSRTPFRLLRLPIREEEEDFPVKLPRVLPSHRPAWESVDFRPPTEQYQLPPVSEQPTQGSEVRQMPHLDDSFPLLHLSENHFPSPGRDAEFSNRLPFPMLQMIDPHRRQVPFFVPSEDIVSRNNNNRDARSGMPTARSEPQTGRSDIPGSSRRSIELLQLGPSLSEADSVLENDFGQVLVRLMSVFFFITNTDSVGRCGWDVRVCLFVCLFVRSIIQK